MHPDLLADMAGMIGVDVSYRQADLSVAEREGDLTEHDRFLAFLS